MLYIGKAQEKGRLLCTERRHPATGATHPWLYSTTAMVNYFYFYAVDDDFATCGEVADPAWPRRDRARTLNGYGDGQETLLPVPCEALAVRAGRGVARDDGASGGP